MVSESKKTSRNEQDVEIEPNVGRKVIHIITTHIILPVCKRTDHFKILYACIAAACSKASISGFTKSHKGLPSHSTCLTYLHKLPMEEMIQESPKMLFHAGRKMIRKGGKFTIAIDKTQDPYYGERDTSPESDIIGGQRKASTNYFISYLTMSIIDRNCHLTLFVIPWKKGMSNVAAIQQCVDQLHKHGIRIRCLCLDREFYDGSIFRYLQKAGINHIIPVKTAGKTLKANLKGRKSTTFEYTLNANSDAPVQLTITDCIVYRKGKNGKHGIEHHAFVVFGIPPSPKRIRQIYMHRFAIESSYRLRNVVKPKTSTKDAKIRYFYLLVSFIIQNLWVSLKWTLCSWKQRGPKVIDQNRLTLEHLAQIILFKSVRWFPLKSLDDIAIT